MRRLCIILGLVPYIMCQGALFIVEFVLSPILIYSEWYEQL